MKIKKVTKKEYSPETIGKIGIGLSLFERVQIEAKTAVRGVGHKREHARATFALWLALPSTFKGLPDSVLDRLGIIDSDSRSLLQIKTQTEFEKVFKVAHGLACNWKKEIMLHQPDHALQTKAFFKTLTANVIASLYRAALIEGDAARVKLWLQVIEDWRENRQIYYSEGNGSGLSDKEKRQLDELISLNTK